MRFGRRVQGLLVTVTAVLCAGSAVADLVAGDVNLDEKVNAIDIQLTINGALGLDVGEHRVDIDVNGAVNAIDIQLCINAALGLVIDRDGDGLCDAGEGNVGTDPDWYDTDTDGSGDGEEVYFYTDALDAYDYYRNATIYVDAANTTGTEDGSSAAPFRTISDAVSAAAPYDEIVVRPGVYEEHVALTPRVWLSGEEGAYHTHLRRSAKQDTPVLTLAHQCAVRGFTMGQPSGTAVWAPESVFMVVSNCVLHDSDTGLYVSSGGAVVFVNNTACANNFGVHAESGALLRTVSNSLFVANALARSVDTGQILRGGYNAFFGNTADTEGSPLLSTDVAHDPDFIAVADLNFHLSGGSPAYDAGDPAIVYRDRDASRNAQGSDGGPFGVIDVEPPNSVIAVNPVSGTVPLIVDLNGSFSNDEWGIVSYSWDMDASDGIQEDFTDPTVRYEYETVDVYTVTLTVVDHTGLSGTSTADIIVGPNQPPELKPIGNRSVTEGVLLEFTLSASDPNAGDTLTYSAANLPDGASFDPATRTFSWEPGLLDAGIYQDIRFSVTDDGLPPLPTFEDITITVGDRNRPPVLAYIPDQQINEGGTLQFSIEATDSDTDNTLAYTATNLPLGARFNQSLRVFSWTPTPEMVGVYQGVLFSVTDDGDPPLTDSQGVTITVRDGSWPTAAASVDPIAGPAPLDVQFTGEGEDPDGGPVTFSWNLDDGTPSTEQSPAHTYGEALALGSYRATLTVTDDERKSTQARAYLTLTETDVLAAGLIDPETGGVLMVDVAEHRLDGVSLTYPPWATTEPFVATIGDMTDAPPAERVNMRYTIELGPAGAHFDPSVTVTVPLPKALHLSQVVDALWFDHAAGGWVDDGISNVLYTEDPFPAVLFDTSHFSIFAVTVTRPIWDLGTMGGVNSFAFSLSEARDVVGYSYLYVSTNDRHAFRWNPADLFLDLGTLGWKHSFAFDINEVGQIAGYYEYEGGYTARPFIWDETNGMRDLGTFGGSYTYAYNLNDGGTVVGSSTYPNGIRHAFLWTEAGGMQDLGTLGGTVSYALSINASGEVVGGAQNAAGETHVFLWDQAHGMQDLGTLGGNLALANAINDVGLVVGHSRTASSDVHGFVWDETNDMRDLGAPDGPTSYAKGLNNTGQVVGSVLFDVVEEEEVYHACLWEEADAFASIRDLHDYIDPEYPLVLIEAWDINENGDIVGSMGDEEAVHAFLIGNE